MARVEILKPDAVDDPAIAEIFDWVTRMEGAVPNHFYVEMNFPEFFKAKLGATTILWEAGELSMEEVQHVGILVLSLIHISEPTRPTRASRMPSSA